MPNSLKWRHVVRTLPRVVILDAYENARVKNKVTSIGLFFAPEAP